MKSWIVRGLIAHGPLRFFCLSYSIGKDVYLRPIPSRFDRAPTSPHLWLSNILSARNRLTKKGWMERIGDMPVLLLFVFRFLRLLLRGHHAGAIETRRYECN